MVFLWHRFGDPLAFSTAQQNDLWERSYRTPLETLELILRSVNLSTEGLLSPQRIDEPIRFDLYVGGPHDANGYNLLFFVIGIAVAVLAFRRIRPSLAAYALAMMFFSAIAGPPWGPLFALPRHVAVIFPLFMVLAIWGQSARVDKLLSYPAVAFLGIFTVRFATWYWVS